MEQEEQHLTVEDDIIAAQSINNASKKPEVVILDDNELSMACYAKEYPENFKEISSAVQIASQEDLE